MFCPDWEQDVILLSHMGESNPKLAQWKPLISDCPFNYNSCGDTTAMYNCLRKGKAVYVNLAPMQDHFTLIVSDVEMLDEGLERGAYRHSTQGWMKPMQAAAAVPEGILPGRRHAPFRPGLRRQHRGDQGVRHHDGLRGHRDQIMHARSGRRIPGLNAHVPEED